jgi:RNA-directed DNA polymerase
LKRPQLVPFEAPIDTPIDAMWRTLCAKLRGHYQYYGINDNWPLLMVFRDHARRMAKRHLSRRSQNSYLSWAKYNDFLAANPLANPGRLTDLIAMSRG